MSMHELSVWETIPAWIEERPIEVCLDRPSFVKFVATTIYNDFGWTSLRRPVSVQEQDETDQTTNIYIHVPQLGEKHACHHTRKI